MSDELRVRLKDAPPEVVRCFPEPGTSKGEPLRDVRLAFRFFDKWSDRQGGEKPPRDQIGAALRHWRDADPDQTYLIVGYSRGLPPRDDRAAMAAVHRLPPEVESLRQEWFGARERGDENEADLRERLHKEMAALGFVFGPAFDAFSTSRATEIAPGAWIQDERPEAASPLGGIERP